MKDNTFLCTIPRIDMSENILIEDYGIIPVKWGGLGNQLFIVSASYIASKKLKCPLYILLNVFENNSHYHNINYNQIVFNNIGTHINNNNSDIYNYLLYTGYKNHNPTKLCYEKYDIDNIKKGTLMNCFYQYYPHIRPYENEIRNMYINNLKLKYDNQLITYDKYKMSAFIHIRRGDYLYSPTKYFIQSIDYYKSSLKLLLEINKNIDNILIFSDDMKWVEEQEFFNSIPNKIFIHNNDELESLYIMSCCKAGAICANSTFSWWGAFLGAYEIRNPVIVPKKWFYIEPDNLFPNEWIIN